MKANSKVKAKAAGKAKAAASKAPGVTSSPMKAPKAKAKSTMKKILKRPAAALPDPEPKANAKAKAKTVKEMAEGWKKKTRDEPVSDEEEEPKEDDATVADDQHRSYPNARKWARMIKSGQVPEDLQQLYEEGSKNSPHPRFSRFHLSTKSFSRIAKASMCLLLEMPSSRVSRRTLRLAPTNLRLLGYLTPSCCGKNPGETDKM